MTPSDLRSIRAALCLTQRQLAERIGITQEAISMMEAGVREITKRTAMQIEALRK